MKHDTVSALIRICEIKANRIYAVTGIHDYFLPEDREDLAQMDADWEHFLNLLALADRSGAEFLADADACPWCHACGFSSEKRNCRLCGYESRHGRCAMTLKNTWGRIVCNFGFITCMLTVDDWAEIRAVAREALEGHQ